MKKSQPPRWLSITILIGMIYFVVGIITGELAASVSSDRMRFFWRLSAFVISGLVLITHIAYEHFRIRSAARSTMWHTTIGAAIGGFCLALMANLHEVLLASNYRPRLLIALVAWPMITAVPALIFTRVAAFILDRFAPRLPEPT